MVWGLRDIRDGSVRVKRVVVNVTIVIKISLITEWVRVPVGSTCVKEDHVPLVDRFDSLRSPEDPPMKSKRKGLPEFPIVLSVSNVKVAIFLVAIPIQSKGYIPDPWEIGVQVKVRP